MRQNKLAVGAVSALTTAALLSSAAAAVDSYIYEPDQKCSLRVTLTLPEQQDAVIEGAEITLYRIADVIVSDSSIHYEYCGDFADFGDANELTEDKALPQKLFEFAQDEKLSGITLATDSKGIAKFENLDAGVYLGGETRKNNWDALFLPFLVCLPTSYDDKWLYDIDATPKIDVLQLTDINVKKVWNDDGTKRPQSVQIALTKNNTVVDTVTLSEANEWKYTWKNLPYGEDWNVKETVIPAGYTATYSKEGLSFTVYNSAALIQTGQLDWPIPLLAGGGLLLIILGFALNVSGRKQKQ